jgi:hypothetical protein
MAHPRIKLKPDAFDVDQLDECVQGAGYKKIAERLVHMLAKKHAELMLPLDEARTNHTRGFIEGVMACQRVPLILRREMQVKMRKGKP